MRRWGAVVLVGLGACSRPARESPATGSALPVAPISSASSVSALALSAEPPALARAAEPAPPACGDAGDVLVFVSPEHPVSGQPLRGSSR